MTSELANLLADSALAAYKLAPCDSGLTSLFVAFLQVVYSNHVNLSNLRCEPLSRLSNLEVCSCDSIFEPIWSICLSNVFNVVKKTMQFFWHKYCQDYGKIPQAPVAVKITLSFYLNFRQIFSNLCLFFSRCYMRRFSLPKL